MEVLTESHILAKVSGSENGSEGGGQEKVGLKLKIFATSSVLYLALCTARLVTSCGFAGEFGSVGSANCGCSQINPAAEKSTL